MPSNIRLQFARIASFLALLCIFLNLFSILNVIIPAGSGRLVQILGYINFTGVALGSILCSLFLPLPNKNGKSKITSLLFIIIITLPNIVLRSLGLDLKAQEE